MQEAKENQYGSMQHNLQPNQSLMSTSISPERDNLLEAGPMLGAILSMLVSCGLLFSLWLSNLSVRLLKSTGLKESRVGGQALEYLHLLLLPGCLMLYNCICSNYDTVGR